MYFVETSHSESGGDAVVSGDDGSGGVLRSSALGALSYPPNPRESWISLSSASGSSCPLGLRRALYEKINTWDEVNGHGRYAPEKCV